MRNEKVADLNQPQLDRLATVEASVSFVGATRVKDSVISCGIQSAVANKCPLHLTHHDLARWPASRSPVPSLLSLSIDMEHNCSFLGSSVP